MNTDFKRYGIFALTLLCSVALNANNNSKYFTNNHEQTLPLVATYQQPQLVSEKAQAQVEAPVNFKANRIPANFAAELPTVSFESNSWDNAESYSHDLVKGLVRSEDSTPVHPVQYEQNFFNPDSITPLSKEEKQVYAALQYDLRNVMCNEDEATMIQKQEATSLFQKAMNGCTASFARVQNFWNQGNKEKALCLVAAGVTTYAGYKIVQTVMTSKTVTAAKTAWNSFCYKNRYNMPAYATIAGSAAAVVAYEALTSGLIKNNLKVGLPVAAGAALAVYGLNKIASCNTTYETKCHTNYKSLPSTCATLGAGATALAYEIALRNSDSTPGKMVANMVIKPAFNKTVETVTTYATKENAAAAVNYLKETASNSYNAAATKLASWWNKAPQTTDAMPESKTILEKVTHFVKQQEWKLFGGLGV